MKQDKTKYGVTCMIHNSPTVGNDGFGSYCLVCYEKDFKFKEFVDNFRAIEIAKIKPSN